MNTTRIDSAFAQVDEVPADLQVLMVDYLERLAALPGIQRVRRVARAALGVHGGQQLLDAGCGLGEEARELARLVGPAGEVTAVDLSEAMVSAAEVRDNGSGVRYAVTDVSALPFPDGMFDGVRSERVLQHVPDPDATVSELTRVTVPGGRVCLIDTDWESFLVSGVPDHLFREVLREFARLAHAENLFKPVGRQLRGRMLRAGLTAVSAQPVPIPIADRQTAETLSPIFGRPFLQQIGMSRELTDPWFAAYQDALARNEFLAVITIWVVTGVKPS